MAKATWEDARSVTASLIREIDPRSVIVFGEVGRSGIGNDLDLLILMDGSRKTSDIRSLIKVFEKSFAIDPFVMTVSHFREHLRKGSPFLKAIIREGRLLYMKNAQSEWEKDAAEELRAAEYLVKGEFWKSACYHAQQSVEKLLKAKLLGKGWELEKVHSITRLAALMADYSIAIDIPDEDLEFLDSIYRGRYPGEAGLLPHGDPSREDASRAIRIARKVVPTDG